MVAATVVPSCAAAMASVKIGLQFKGDRQPWGQSQDHFFVRGPNRTDTLWEGARIGDMCVPNLKAGFQVVKDKLDRKGHTVTERLESRKHRDVVSVCTPAVPDDRRVLLLPVVPMYHSSTALEGVFMSSSKISTLCSSKVWECEGQWVLKEKFGIEQSMARNMLEVYANYWDLDKPVLLEKGPRKGEKLIWETQELERESRPKNLPDKFIESGIDGVDFAYVLMWRPVCLSWLSSHARTLLEAGNKTGLAMEELDVFEDLVDSYQYLTNRSHPVLVLSLADVLWNSERAQQRLMEFIPCVGELDFDFVPELGRDIFPENFWKADGSVKAFGASVDANECCGYSIWDGICSPDGKGDLFHTLPDDLRQRAKAAEEFLRALS